MREERIDIYLETSSYLIRILYGILCTGLTLKTRLSFISSNSSFTECVRNPISQSNVIEYKPGTSTIIGADNHYFFHSTTRTNTSTHLSPGRLQLSTSATFTSCVWNGCTSDTGGAIYVTTSAIALSVNSCQFLSCVAKGLGGGIYAQSSHSVCVEETLFHRCRSDASSSDIDGGGGLFFDYISTQILISSSTFCDCSAKTDGAGVDVWHSYFTSANSRIMQDCSFVKCIIPKSVGCEGGAIYIWDNNVLKCSDSLFTLCEGYEGGAYASNCQSGKPNYQLEFCFFHANEGTSGNDLHFRNGCSDIPLFQCFSTAQNNRISGVSNKDNDWLPVTTVGLSLSEPQSNTHTYTSHLANEYTQEENQKDIDSVNDEENDFFSLKSYP